MSRTLNKCSQLKHSGGSNMVLAAGCPEEETYDNNAMKVFFSPPLSSHQSFFYWIISHSATM